jgi:hypothetical protein
MGVNESVGLFVQQTIMLNDHCPLHSYSCHYGGWEPLFRAAKLGLPQISGRRVLRVIGHFVLPLSRRRFGASVGDKFCRNTTDQRWPLHRPFHLLLALFLFWLRQEAKGLKPDINVSRRDVVGALDGGVFAPNCGMDSLPSWTAVGHDRYCYDRAEDFRSRPKADMPRGNVRAVEIRHGIVIRSSELEAVIMGYEVPDDEWATIRPCCRTRHAASNSKYRILYLSTVGRLFPLGQMKNY